jgi:hypothetical protein
MSKRFFASILVGAAFTGLLAVVLVKLGWE